jgi:putative oxidoreductase
MSTSRTLTTRLTPSPLAVTLADRRSRTVDAFDAVVAQALRPIALPTLRVLLGVLFLWFGGLKVAGASPVAAMVAATLPWVDPDVVVPVLGTVEVLLGLGLIAGVALRVVLPALVAHLAGTFLTFVMLPGEMFRESDPLLLTQSGEFVVKNLVLVCAALVLIAHADPARQRKVRPSPR